MVKRRFGPDFVETDEDQTETVNCKGYRRMITHYFWLEKEDTDVSKLCGYGKMVFHAKPSEVTLFHITVTSAGSQDHAI